MNVKNKWQHKLGPLNALSAVCKNVSLTATCEQMSEVHSWLHIKGTPVCSNSVAGANAILLKRTFNHSV